MWMKILAASLLVFAAACSQEARQAETHQADPQTEAQTETKLSEPQLEKIADGVWIHKSWNVIEPWGLVLSQGLVVKSDGGVFLVDTAWNDADTEKLLALIEAETGELPNAAIVTHAHADKMGGMNALHAAGIPSFAHQFSNEDAPKRNLTPATHSLSNKELIRFDIELKNAGIEGNSDLIIVYPGPGHTRDNIVVYYERADVLFGGCLIRPGDAADMGNTADGDVSHWAEAVRNAAAPLYHFDGIVIPSHGPMGGRDLLDHTIALAEAEAAKP